VGELPLTRSSLTPGGSSRSPVVNAGSVSRTSTANRRFRGASPGRVTSPSSSTVTVSDQEPADTRILRGAETGAASVTARVSVRSRTGPGSSTSSSGRSSPAGAAHVVAGSSSTTAAGPAATSVPVEVGASTPTSAVASSTSPASTDRRIEAVASTSPPNG
jgi:hypothetical protein